MGSWRVAFAVLNTGPTCRLQPKTTLARVGRQVLGLKQTIDLPADRFVVLQVVFRRPGGPCEPRTRTDADPLELVVLSYRNGRTEVRSRPVPGVRVPAGVLDCSRHAVVQALLPQPIPTSLRERATYHPNRSHLTLTADLPHDIPAGSARESRTVAALGVQLPLLCGEDWGRYDEGATGRVSAQVSVASGGDETRQFDSYRTDGAAESAYDYLLNSVRDCPQRGQQGLTASLSTGRVGADSWTLAGVDTGTGAGFTYVNWIVVHRGRTVIVDFTQGPSHGRGLVATSQRRFSLMLDDPS